MKKLKFEANRTRPKSALDDLQSQTFPDGSELIVSEHTITLVEKQVPYVATPIYQLTPAEIESLRAETKKAVEIGLKVFAKKPSK